MNFLKNAKIIICVLALISISLFYYIWSSPTKNEFTNKTSISKTSKSNIPRKLSGNAMDYSNHKEMIKDLKKSDFNLSNQFESMNCDSFTIRPYASMSCIVSFNTNLPEIDLGSIMVHFVNSQDNQNTAMLGCLYNNPDNKKVLLCENDIMYIKKGIYIPELSLIEQTRNKVSEKNLVVEGEDYPYEITETVNIN